MDAPAWEKNSLEYFSREGEGTGFGSWFDSIVLRPALNPVPPTSRHDVVKGCYLDMRRRGLAPTLWS